eukprot:347571-Chlamydomonas_euryale.AAC.1
MKLAVAAMLENPKTPGVPSDMYVECGRFSRATNSPYRPTVAVSATPGELICYYSSMPANSCAGSAAVNSVYSTTPSKHAMFLGVAKDADVPVMARPSRAGMGLPPIAVVHTI